MYAPFWFIYVPGRHMPLSCGWPPADEVMERDKNGDPLEAYRAGSGYGIGGAAAAAMGQMSTLGQKPDAVPPSVEDRLDYLARRVAELERTSRLPSPAQPQYWPHQPYWPYPPYNPYQQGAWCQTGNGYIGQQNGNYC